MLYSMNIDRIKNKSRSNSTTSKNESPKKSPSNRNQGSSDSGKSRTKDSVKLDSESKEPKGDDKRVGSILGGLAESLGRSGKGEKSDKGGKTEKGGGKLESADKSGDPKEPDLSEKNIDAVTEAANESKDPAKLDEIDSFRAQLPPDQQKIYDEQLADLREDERIRFVSHDGAGDDLATRDLALRGILTASFGNPEDLEKALDTAAHSGHDEDGNLVEKKNGDGHLDIHLYDGEFPLDPLKDPDGEQFGAALVTSGGDIHANTGFFRDTIKDGENVFTHEFTHVMQGSSADGKWRPGNDFPQDFPDELKERFENEFKSDNFQDYFKEIGLNNDFGGESYPGVQTVFRYYPEDLKENSPELYDVLASYNGYDPLEGKNVDRQVQPPSDDDGIVDRVIDFGGSVIDTLNPLG